MARARCKINACYYCYLVGEIKKYSLAPRTVYQHRSLVHRANRHMNTRSCLPDIKGCDVLGTVESQESALDIMRLFVICSQRYVLINKKIKICKAVKLLYSKRAGVFFATFNC